MKKIYSKPSIEVESFVSEEIMESQKNVLSSLEVTDGSRAWKFITISEGVYGDNVVNSIDYTNFAN